MTDRPTEQQVQDAVAGDYEALRYRLPYARRYHAWWMRRLIRLAGGALNRPGLVLDNGCGPATLHRFLPEHAERIVGLDLSMGMLREGRAYAGRLVQGDCRFLPFEDGAFELIFARSLLHHLPDPAAGVAEMHRVLRPGGRVVLTDTNKTALSTLPRRIAYRGEHFSDDHTNFTARRYLATLAERFEIERVEYFGYLAYPLGFPDMMGPVRKLPFPGVLVDGLIAVDRVIAKLPVVKGQSWGINVSVRKA
jgi:ubiquinone/menaquinone biosynthesis C-methylase UbiE